MNLTHYTVDVFNILPHAFWDAFHVSPAVHEVVLGDGMKLFENQETCNFLILPPPQLPTSRKTWFRKTF